MRGVSSLNLINEYLNHKCLVMQGKYKRGSKYKKNLNDLFRHISTLSSGWYRFLTHNW
ncbi:hypothetical protein AALP_AA4G174200 [Arabis alpina]|uniref:Uncharacterized protein n=1 Tax=Arabis alpina TaxID=50452 RepID=A0A087H3V7_ARAAL|nr:hypothetical protein AALP_AA4G174200 [Arabis alpina]